MKARRADASTLAKSHYLPRGGRSRRPVRAKPSFGSATNQRMSSTASNGSASQTSPMLPSVPRQGSHLRGDEGLGGPVGRGRGHGVADAAEVAPQRLEGVLLLVDLRLRAEAPL